VELGEIETRLLKRPGLKEAVVTVVGGMKAGVDSNDKLLCAYFTSLREVEAHELREYLSHGLPGYMVPAHFVQLEKMPLTPNGKVDRKALPRPRPGVGEGYAAPDNEMEKRLVSIWGEVLGISADVIGIHDDFFELGGHSLKATLLAARVSKEFNVKFSLTHVFTNPTVREFARVIKETKKSIYEEVKPVPVKEYYPQSSAQKRLFFLEQFENIGTSYNIPSVLQVEGKLDKERLECAVKALIQRHDTLRTSFELIDNKAVQRVHDTVEFEMEYDIAERKAQGAERKEERHAPCAMRCAGAVKNFIRPFDLSRAPLLRVGLVTTEKDKYLLLYDIHHIIGDGTSMGILIADFVKLYDEQELPPLKVQYKDFACWQNHLLETGRFKEQEEYWLHIYAGEIPRLNFPTDFPRPEALDFAGNRYRFILNKEEARAIKSLGLEHGATLFMVLLAAFNVLLYKYTGQSDIIVGTGIMGRPHPDLQRCIGMFVNSLALRNRPRGEKTYLQFLREVKENCIEAFANQDIQFEELVDKLNIQRDPSRNPLFDVLLVVQNFEQAKPANIRASQLKDVKFAPYEHENRTAKFDLNLSVWEKGDKILFSLEYAAALFKPSTAREIANNLMGILRLVINEKEISLKDIDISNELLEVTSTISQTDRGEFNF
jgi:tyrocidine synthetase-3